MMKAGASEAQRLQNGTNSASEVWFPVGPRVLTTYAAAMSFDTRVLELEQADHLTGDLKSYQK